MSFFPLPNFLSWFSTQNYTDSKFPPGRAAGIEYNHLCLISVVQVPRTRKVITWSWRNTMLRSFGCAERLGFRSAALAWRHLQGVQKMYFGFSLGVENQKLLGIFENVWVTAPIKRRMMEMSCALGVLCGNFCSSANPGSSGWLRTSPFSSFPGYNK